MDQQKIDMYLMTNAKYFESHQIDYVRQLLENADNTKFPIVQSVNLKDPTIMLIISLLAGSLGIDRFMVGDVGLGVAKLLTCGGLGIWALVDLFLIMGRAREVNFNNVQTVLS